MHMQWRPNASFLTSLPLPEGFAFAQLDSSRVNDVIARLKDWFSEIEAGSEACHLDPQFYADKVFLADKPETQNRLIFPLLLLDGNRIVFYFSLQIEPNSRTLTGRFLVMDPAYRGKGLGHLAPAIVERAGLSLGAELVYYYVALNTIQQQLLSENAGYELVGIIPASDRVRLPSGGVKRIYEGIYAKVLVGENDCHLPPREVLTERTQKLWDFLFTSKPATL